MAVRKMGILENASGICYNASRQKAVSSPQGQQNPR